MKLGSLAGGEGHQIHGGPGRLEQGQQEQECPEYAAKHDGFHRERDRLLMIRRLAAGNSSRLSIWTAAIYQGFFRHHLLDACSYEFTRY